jgi:hypothetical protein
VEFHCEGGSGLEEERDLLLDLTEPGTNLWWPEQENEERHRYFSYEKEPARWPLWRKGGLEFREFEDAERRRHFQTVYFSVQWILKCHCADSCGDEVVLPQHQWLATARPTNGEGEVILHRVHRTAAP